MTVIPFPGPRVRVPSRVWHTVDGQSCIPIAVHGGRVEVKIMRQGRVTREMIDADRLLCMERVMADEEDLTPCA